MSVLEGDRRPRGKYVLAVMEGFRNNHPRSVIRARHGLTPAQLNSAIHQAVNHGHIPSDEEDQFRQWRKETRTRPDPSTFRKVEFRLDNSELQEGVLRICAPFFLRGFFTDEIIEITGSNRRKILNSRMSAKGLGMEKTTPEMRRKIQKRNHPVGGVREYSLSERNAFRFAKALLEAGLIPLPEDPDPKASLKAWNELHELFRMPGSPPLPENNADRLRLEFFLRAWKEFKKGNKGLISKYIEIGGSVNGVWFRETLVGEQAFIMSNVV